MSYEKNKTFISDTENVRSIIEEAIQNAIDERLPEIVEAVREDEIYTTKELCELFKVSHPSVKYWRDNGKIDWIQTGGRTIRYTRQHVRDFIKNNLLSVTNRS